MNKKPVTKLCTEMFKYIFFKKVMGDVVRSQSVQL